MTDLLTLTEELCAVPSVSGSEAALADLVEARLRERAPQMEVVRVGANVIARTVGGARLRIVLGGHLDTVPANSNNATPRRDGDTLHGLGATDMKGGLAIMLELAVSIAANAGARDVHLSMRHKEWLERPQSGETMVTYDLTGDVSSAPAAKKQE